MRFWLVFLIVVNSPLLVFPQNARAAHPQLHAPTYYIVVSGRLWDENEIRVRGASNLPPGSRIAIQAGDGSTFVTKSICARVDGEGFFAEKLHPERGAFKWTSKLTVGAVFRTNQCQQPYSVLQIVGKHGQYLGNDNFDEKIDVHMEMTPGMDRNPQLFQESGWYFGLSTFAKVSH